MIKWSILSSRIIKGISLKPKDPGKYPVTPLIIKGEFDVQK